MADCCIWHGSRTSLSRRQSATVAGASTDQARVCLAVPPLASATLVVVSSTRASRDDRTAITDTLASTAGASTRELMTRMGHSSSRAALIYQHMTSDRDRAIADRLGVMIRGGGGVASASPGEDAEGT